MPKYSPRKGFEGNEMSRALFNYIKATLPEGKTILELGSGWGTSQLMKYWDVWSVEDKAEWHQKFNKEQSLLVPIKNGWYDREILQNSIRRIHYNLLLVDGPHPESRRGFIANFDLFRPNVPVVFDDVRREEGRAVAEAIAEIKNKPLIMHEGAAFGVV